MIKLVDLINEFEYGKSIFADPLDKSVENKPAYKSMLKKFDITPEKNTEDEKNFLKNLQI